MSHDKPVTAVDIAPKANTAAIIVLCRYLASRDKDLAAYLQDSLVDAEAAGLPDETLSTLRLLVKSIGG